MSLMTSDSAYFATCKTSLNHLIEGAKGEWKDIPQHYLNYFDHVFSDGSISLIPAVSKFENLDFLESWQVDEVVSALIKVNQREWPDYEDIQSIDLESFLSPDIKEPDTVDYVEDNLGTSEKTQRVLKSVIESVFGEKVSSIRSRQGKYPSPSNNFLQEKDGTFSGTFKFEENLFDFEVLPTERGWVCTYRLDEKSLDKLSEPEFTGRRSDNKPKHRKVRSQGWR